MPVYDKPLIYYPLTTLMLSGIKEILIISSPEEIGNYKRLLQRSSSWGLSLTFDIQPNPGGLAEALLIGEDFLAGSLCTLILGDNFFHGSGLGRSLQGDFDGIGAQIAAYRVADPRAFGVVEFDKDGLVISLEEKPQLLRSNWAVPGIYRYDSSASERAKSISRSERGELEITDLNLSYLLDGMLKVKVLPRGTTWLDMGTPKSLLEASEYIRIIQDRQGTLVGSPEEAAWSMGWINDEELIDVARENGETEYTRTLLSLVRRDSNGFY